MNRKRIVQTKINRAKDNIKSPSPQSSTKSFYIPSNETIPPITPTAEVTKEERTAPIPHREPFKQCCLRRDLTMLPHNSSLLHEKQHIKRVFLRSFEYNIPKLTTAINMKQHRKGFKTLPDTFKYCRTFTWKDNIHLRHPQFLSKVLTRPVGIQKLNIELHPPRPGGGNPYNVFTKAFRILPKSLRVIKIAVLGFYPTLAECLEALYSKIRMLPHLEILIIDYHYSMPTTLLKLDVLYKSLYRNKILKQFVLAPLLLAPLLQWDEDKVSLERLTHLKAFTEFGIILEDVIINALPQAAQFLSKLVSLKSILVQARFNADFSGIMASLGALNNLHKLQLEICDGPIALDELVNLSNVRSLCLKYFSVKKWSPRRYERDVEVLTFIDKLESLELNFTECIIHNIKYLGVCLGRIKNLKRLKVSMPKTYSRDSLIDFLKALKSESVGIQDLSISVMFSDQKVLEIDALSAWLKKLKKLEAFELVTLEDGTQNKAVFTPGTMRKLCEGLGSSKDRLKRINLHINRCEGFSDKKSVTIISEFLKSLRNVEEIEVNIGKRYFTDSEVRALLMLALEVEKVKRVKIEGDFSIISQKGFQFVVQCVKELLKKKEIEVVPRDYVKANHIELKEAVEEYFLKKMF